MTRIHNLKPMIFCTFPNQVWIELYKLKNPQKNTSCLMLPLVALPRLGYGSHMLSMWQIELSNPKKTLAAYLKGLKKTMNVFCSLSQQSKSDLILKRLFRKLLFLIIPKNLFKGELNWYLERLFTPKETANLSPGCAKQNMALPLGIKAFFRYSQGVLYSEPKGMRLTKERSTKPVCILHAVAVPIFLPRRNPGTGRKNTHYSGVNSKRSQIQLQTPTLCYGIGCSETSAVHRGRVPKFGCRKSGSFSFLDPADFSVHFSLNGYNRVSVCKNHAAIINGKIENNNTNKKDFCYTTKTFKGESIHVSVFGLAQQSTPKRGLGTEQKSLAVLRGLHLLENSIKSTKKRKSVLKVYLIRQISLTTLASNKSNQPKLERLMLPYLTSDRGVYPNLLRSKVPCFAKVVVERNIELLSPQRNILPWYNLLFDFLTLTCYGVRLFEQKSNAVMLRRVFLFYSHSPFLLPLAMQPLPPLGQTPGIASSCRKSYPSTQARPQPLATQPLPLPLRSKVPCFAVAEHMPLPLWGGSLSVKNKNPKVIKGLESKKGKVQCIKVCQKQVTKSEPLLPLEGGLCQGASLVTCNKDSQKTFRAIIYPTVRNLVALRVKIRQEQAGLATLPLTFAWHNYGKQGRGGRQLLPLPLRSKVPVTECIWAKHVMSMRSIYHRYKRYSTIQKRDYWRECGVLTFLNYKPVYRQLVSKMYAISGFQAIFCYHWVYMYPHKVLFVKLFHPCTWVSWFARTEHTLGSCMQNAYGLIKNSKKGSKLVVNSASVKKDRRISFFKLYLLYLKKLISQPGNLPLPFLITKLNRSIISWKRDLYLLTLPETQRGRVKNPINDSERGDSFLPLPDFRQPYATLPEIEFRLRVHQPPARHGILCMFTPLKIDLCPPPPGQTYYPSSPTGLEYHAEHISAVHPLLCNPYPFGVGVGVGWPRPAGMKKGGCKKDAQLFSAEGTEQDLAAYINDPYLDPLGFKLLRSNSFFLSFTFLAGILAWTVCILLSVPCFAKVVVASAGSQLAVPLYRFRPGTADCQKIWLPKIPIGDLWTRFICSTKGSIVPSAALPKVADGLCLTLLDPISKIGKSKIVHFSYPNLYQKFAFFLRLKRVKGKVGCFTSLRALSGYISQANPEKKGQLKIRDQVGSLSLISYTNLLPTQKKKRGSSGVFYQLTPPYATKHNVRLLYPLERNGDNTIYRGLAVILAQKNLSLSGFTYILMHDTWFNTNSYPFSVGLATLGGRQPLPLPLRSKVPSIRAKHSFPGPMRRIWLPSHALLLRSKVPCFAKVVVAGGQVQLPDVVANPITHFHTHTLKKYVFYKNKPTYLESCKKKQQSQYLNFYISKLLWKQVKKRHPTQSNKWLFDKYWKWMQNIPHFYVSYNKRLFIIILFNT